MKRLLGCILIAILSLAGSLSAQNGNPDDVKKVMEDTNAALQAARQATKEKRFADSEALMLKLTATHPELIFPWVELGLAQIGLKKYPEAENSFKVALGLNPASQRLEHSSDFYQEPDAKGAVAPTATRNSRSNVGGVVSNGQARTPEIQGVSYGSLGEIYIHEGKIAEAESAFDMAVKAYPASTALYRRNETVLFFQAGQPEAQLAAAEKAIAADPGRAMLYFFKGQALVGKATIDPVTQKMHLPPGCAEAYQKYLEMEPNGQFSVDAKGVLAGAGIPLKGGKS